MSNYEKTSSTGSQGNVGFKPYKVLTANTTLTAADSGSIYGIGTDALVITLPATVAGCEFEFVNIGANGNNIVTISPVAADGIAGTITLAATVVVRAGTVDVDLVNTKATTKVGDSVKLVGTGATGVTAWVIKSSTGIWS